MHPEIRQPGPGKCPKCGMDLVLESELKKKPRIHVANAGTSASLGPITWKSYIPLIVIFLLLFAGTVAVSWSDYLLGTFSIADSIGYFMAGFFLVFAGFKLIDLKGFAEGYSTYDLLAMRWREYAFVYPFIELGFGLTMLAGYHPEWLLWTEFAVMAFSGLGVSIKLLKREAFQCVCLGTLLKVPLTYVTLLEDFGMALLALILILI
jgi:hypothetical protein